MMIIIILIIIIIIIIISLQQLSLFICIYKMPYKWTSHLHKYKIQKLNFLPASLPLFSHLASVISR